MLAKKAKRISHVIALRAQALQTTRVLYYIISSIRCTNLLSICSKSCCKVYIQVAPTIAAEASRTRHRRLSTVAEDKLRSSSSFRERSNEHQRTDLRHLEPNLHSVRRSHLPIAALRRTLLFPRVPLRVASNPWNNDGSLRRRRHARDGDAGALAARARHRRAARQEAQDDLGAAQGGELLAADEEEVGARDGRGGAEFGRRGQDAADGEARPEEARDGGRRDGGRHCVAVGTAGMPKVVEYLWYAGRMLILDFVNGITLNKYSQ